MQKKNFILLFSSIMLSFCSKIYAQTDSITVSGKLNGLGNQTVSVSFTDFSGQVKNYRAVARNDHFSFRAPLQETPVIARFNASIDRSISGTNNGQRYSNPAPALDLFMYNRDIHIEGDALLLQFASVTGDEENNMFNHYKESVRQDELRSYELMRALLSSDKAATENPTAFQKEIRDTRNRITVRQKEFIVQHPDALASAFLLSRMQNFYNANDYTAAWNGLSGRYKNHPAAKSIRDYVEKISSSLAGTPVADFERNDKNGRLVRLSAYKGRTILLDFWGSWCGPCRASHPHLKELYKKYKDKGFEIIAIAQERGKTLHESKNSWLKAIADDDINWVHILNQDGVEKQDLVKSYRVNAFPTKILVDTEGKIILRITASATDDIDKALEKVYGY